VQPAPAVTRTPERAGLQPADAPPTFTTGFYALLAR
jgi:hypothetical protein